MCFSIDVSILSMDIRVINAQTGKDSFDNKYGSFSYDWYCTSMQISKTKICQFCHKGFHAFL